MFELLSRPGSIPAPVTSLARGQGWPAAAAAAAAPVPLWSRCRSSLLSPRSAPSRRDPTRPAAAFPPCTRPGTHRASHALLQALSAFSTHPCTASARTTSTSAFCPHTSLHTFRNCALTPRFAPFCTHLSLHLSMDPPLPAPFPAPTSPGTFP